MKKKKRAKKREICIPEVMEKYNRLRRITFNGFWMIILIVFLLVPNQSIRLFLLSVTLMPILIVAVIAAKMYSTFPTKTKKSLKLDYLPIDPIELHPYAAVCYVLVTQIVFVLLAFNVITN